MVRSWDDLISTPVVDEVALHSYEATDDSRSAWNRELGG